MVVGGIHNTWVGAPSTHVVISLQSFKGKVISIPHFISFTAIGMVLSPIWLGAKKLYSDNPGTSLCQVYVNKKAAKSVMKQNIIMKH